MPRPRSRYRHKHKYPRQPYLPDTKNQPEPLIRYVTAFIVALCVITWIVTPHI